MAIIRQYHKDTDTTYVYESESYWDPELKQARSKRRCIGKVDPDTGEVIPTGKRGRKNEKKHSEDYDALNRQLTKAKQEKVALTARISELESLLADKEKQLAKYKNALKKIEEISTSASF